MLYWIWLSLSLNVGGSSFKKLLSKNLSPEEIYSLSREELKDIIGEKTKDLDKLSDKDTKRASEVLDFCTKKGVGILTYSDDKYPDSLREIDSPPVLFYYRGVLPDFNSMTAISVVGTRSVSDYGRRNAFEISRSLSLSGALIVSGMALGIDGVAHAGAISAGMPTVAIIGSGIDVCYPIQHKALAKNIVKTGAVLTEYPPRTKPERFNFPKRNRIIAALSSATLLIEGSEKSGALITARYAKEFGKRVYALPANVGTKNAEAPLLIIKEGAFAIGSASDIIRDFESGKAPLNPFYQSSDKEVDMNSVLTSLSVSATAPSDGIFKPTRKNKAKKESGVIEKLPFGFSNKENSENSEDFSVKEEKEPDLSAFDKTAVEVYKRIPIDKDCLVESLIGDGIELPKVMTSLLKLEVMGMVTMLPGDRVKRIQ